MMMNKMFLAILLVLISKPQFSLQLSGDVCDNDETGKPECCYNFENINGFCTQCKIGTVSQPGGRCLPCKQNKYGVKCLDDCECNNSQRCDAEIGCIVKTSTTIDTRNIEYDFTTLKVTTHLSEDPGTSTLEWTIFTLCVIGFLFIIGISHGVRSYRKRISINVRRDNERELDMRHERVEQPYIGIYDEIDESLVGMDNRDPILAPHLRNNRAIITDVRTMTKDNDEEDNSSYLDPFFAGDGTDCQSSFKDSSSINSSKSDNFIPDDTGYLNPYQPLCEREQNISDDYKVAVYVDHNSGNLSGSDSFENGSSIDRHSHVHQQLQQGQRKNADEYVKPTTIYNEQDINYTEKNKKDSCKNQISANKNSIAS